MVYRKNVTTTVWFFYIPNLWYIEHRYTKTYSTTTIWKILCRKFLYRMRYGEKSSVCRTKPPLILHTQKTLNLAVDSFSIMRGNDYALLPTDLEIGDRFSGWQNNHHMGISHEETFGLHMCRTTWGLYSPSAAATVEGRLNSSS